ncbi:C1 family peptidase [Desulforhopalus sp. 52FAK]
MAKAKQKKSKSKANKEKDGSFERLDGFLLNTVADAPDIRDYAYQPTLLSLKDKIECPKDLTILDQGTEGACTGFGLAAAINLQLAQRGEQRRVSPRMLYEMAKKFDEWEGEAYSGSSCRGAISGWYNTGVCSEELAPYTASAVGWQLTLDQARDARATTIGAYYRINKRLSDFHAALNEVNAIYVSASVHEGWRKKNIKKGVIPFKGAPIGGHAFAIVGYNSDGFFVQNSWGETWGNDGVALWSYEDWLANIKDAWVVRLALSTPQIWHLTPNASTQSSKNLGLFKKSPTRSEILGHFVHIDDGEFDDKGKYWMDLPSINDTAKYVAENKKYNHLLLYAHGGLNSITDSARRIAAMKEVFKANGIYPFHFMYDTGLLEEIKDIVFGKKDDVEKRVGGFTDFTDSLIEKATRPLGRALWREMKSGAKKPFEPEGAGTQTIKSFLDAFSADGIQPKKLHIVGHSTGAILLASLLQSMGGFANVPRVESCSLLAPACTHKVFKDVYRPLLHARDADTFGINKMVIYNLNGDLERKDTVTPLYRKSLLYLVSNAFEEKIGDRILGMQMFYRFLRNLPGSSTLRFEVSDGESSSPLRTSSETHGGFDNDSNTMNDILRTVLKSQPSMEFTEKNLDY